MTTFEALRTSMLVRVAETVNRTLVLPVVIFHATSRCNSRCVSCDWWRSDGAGDLTLAEIDLLAAGLPGLGVRVVVFSGGEPLLRPDVFDAAVRFSTRGLALHLLTSGVLLDRCAGEVARHFGRVVISLDAPTEAAYQVVRGVPALARVERGVALLRAAAPATPVTARATLSRLNFRLLPALVGHARAMALDGISFLAADVASLAFGRLGPIEQVPLVLSADEVAEFRTIVEATIAAFPSEFASGFIAESPDRLRRLPDYFAAVRGEGPYPAVACNAPWMSVVVEADGAVRPCFFHERIGNVRDQPLSAIVTTDLAAFRARLDVARDPMCRRCVCSIRTGLRSSPWH